MCDLNVHCSWIKQKKRELERTSMQHWNDNFRVNDKTKDYSFQSTGDSVHIQSTWTLGNPCLPALGLYFFLLRDIKNVSAFSNSLDPIDVHSIYKNSSAKKRNSQLWNDVRQRKLFLATLPFKILIIITLSVNRHLSIKRIHCMVITRPVTIPINKTSKQLFQHW